MLKIYGKENYIIGEFIFCIVVYWGRFMVFIFIFTGAWGCRKRKFNFFHLILSNTLSKWRPLNILKYIFLFNPHISFNEVTLYCSIIKIWFKIFNMSIAHYQIKCLSN